MDRTNILLPLTGVHSAHCATRVEEALHNIPDLTAAKVDLAGEVALLGANASAQVVREAVAAIRAAGYQVRTEQHRFTTSNITCSGCSNRATILLNSLAGVMDVKIDHASRTAELEVVQGMLTEQDLSNALRPAGYGLLPAA